jgi:hypothetical protein
MAAPKKKNNKKDYPASQFFNFAPGSYLERTSRPIYAIAFLLPFIVFYEIGTLLINTDVLSQSQIRVVAFVWLQQTLEYVGSGSRFAWAAPPLVVVAILLGYQLAARKPWSFRLKDYPPMLAECILLAVPLIVFSLFFNSPPMNPDPGGVGAGTVAQAVVATELQATADGQAVETAQNHRHRLMASIVTGVGAGIYEEMVFRFILICVLMALCQYVFRLDHTNALVLSVLLSAALFSAHHHVVFVDGQLNSGSPFHWGEFAFRTLAGIYFACLFAVRGFGITAGTHALYDVIATAVNALFFVR